MLPTSIIFIVQKPKTAMDEKEKKDAILNETKKPTREFCRYMTE